MTLCRDCDLRHNDTRKLSPYRWRCVQYPAAPEAPRALLNVDPDYRPDPPYQLCIDVNPPGNICLDFKPRRELPKTDPDKPF